MDVAGSAVGIASLGIQICQGLLSYYDDWKGYHSDISSTYESIDDLSRTLILLKASLHNDELDEEKKDRNADENREVKPEKLNQNPDEQLQFHDWEKKARIIKETPIYCGWRFYIPQFLGELRIF